MSVGGLTCVSTDEKGAASVWIFSVLLSPFTPLQSLVKEKKVE
jgi:hypothetical protein